MHCGVESEYRFAGKSELGNEARKYSGSAAEVGWVHKSSVIIYLLQDRSANNIITLGIKWHLNKIIYVAVALPPTPSSNYMLLP